MTTKLDYLMAAVLTQSTCSEACWCAAEEECHCSCGGKNHGIFRRTGERPERTCRIDGVWYKLGAVGSFVEISKQAHELCKAAEANGDPRWFSAADRATPKANQKKWPEVVNSGERYPYLLWVRVEAV